MRRRVMVSVDFFVCCLLRVVCNDRERKREEEEEREERNVSVEWEE